MAAAIANPNTALHINDPMESPHMSVTPRPLMSRPAAEPDDGQPPRSCYCQRFRGGAIRILCCIGAVPVFIVLVPALALYAAGVWFFCCPADVTEDDSEEQGHKREQGTTANHPFFRRVAEAERAVEKLSKGFKIVRSRMVISLLAWLTLNLCIPQLKGKIFLGSELWKWSLLLAMACCGYTLISPVTWLLLKLLSNIAPIRNSKNALYMARGLRQSVNLIILTWSVLATWVFYFKSSRGLKKTPDMEVIFHVLTWTFATVAIGAVLWLIKNALLLTWEANVVYRRFRKRILSAGFQLYFLGRICGWDSPKLENFKPNKEDLSKKTSQHLKEASNTSESYPKKYKDEGATDHTDDNDKTNNEAEEKKRKAKENLLIERVKFYKSKTTYDIKEMTQYLMHMSKSTSREDDGTSYILKKCNEMFNNEDSTRNDITVTDLENVCTEHSATLFKDLCREHKLENPETISYENFEKSMVIGHKNCVALGRTLSDAQEAVKVLNKTMTGALITIAIVAWLLLTDIATDKILVLIASPFLAATFVFGDTCKKIFEGLIFSFITHPFDVGDLCIIDGLELEVKRMGIMTTQFILIASKEEGLYPNSDLAAKSIINLKGEPNPNDRVVLKLGRSTSTSKVNDLKAKITEFFEEDKRKTFEGQATITIEEIGSQITMIIQFHHVFSIHDVTHSQCYEKKRKQKSEFLLKIAEYIKEIGIEMPDG